MISKLIKRFFNRSTTITLADIHAVAKNTSIKSDIGVFTAYYFASAAHAAVGQLRKYTNEPYIVHPLMVHNIVSLVGGNDTMLAAALLHDVVEDTQVSLELIEATFGSEVSIMVGELTDLPKVEGENRACRISKNIERLANASPEAQTVKLADLISNTISIVEHDHNFALVYLREKARMLEVLRKGDPRLWDIAYELVRSSRVEIALKTPVITQYCETGGHGPITSIRGGVSQLRELVCKRDDVAIMFAASTPDELEGAFYTEGRSSPYMGQLRFDLYINGYGLVGHVDQSLPEPEHWIPKPILKEMAICKANLEKLIQDLT